MPYWLFQAIAIGNQQNVVGDSGNVVYFDHPAVVEALQAWRDAANSSALPRGLTPRATAPTDFTAGRAAMVGILPGA